MEKFEDVFATNDPWASPTQQVFTVIGIVFISYKIFTFWRMIASLFILPGKSVWIMLSHISVNQLTVYSFRSLAEKALGLS